MARSAELASAGQALLININAAEGLQKVLKTNLGPRGTLKMLVSASGDIKVTKDGCVLLKEMQIQHPTASLIARCATSQDKITGDGTTSAVLLIGELLKLSKRYLEEGVHPRIIADGFDLAKHKTLSLLKTYLSQHSPPSKELLTSVALTSLSTKLRPELATHLAPLLVSAIQTIQKPNQPIDLHMVEIQVMQHRSDLDTTFVSGLVLDHGGRHPAMPKEIKNAFVLTMNVNLEYEKPEFNANVVWDSAEARDAILRGEHALADERVKAIIALKRKVCESWEGEGECGFLVVNQKGIDPVSLAALAAEGILALRRAKRRNMERLTLACGGKPVNSTDDLTPEVLGFAGSVTQYVLGEEKYTFVEDVKNPLSATMLIRGPHKHVITRIKDAIRDGLRAVKNAIDDGGVIPGAGAFELGASEALKEWGKEVKGAKELGVQLFAEALLVVPKTLAVNSGLDPTKALLKMREAQRKGVKAGLDVYSGEAIDPAAEGIWDNYRVKRQLLNSASVVATQLLLVDELLKSAGGKR